MVIQKYKNPGIELGSLQNDLFPSELNDLLGNLQQFESDVNALTNDLAAIDDSISKFKESYDKTTHNLVKYGNAAADKFLGTMSNKAKFVWDALAIGGKVVVDQVQKKKKTEAHQHYVEQLNSLLEKKRMVAREKLPNVTRYYSNFKETVGDKVEELYKREFYKTSLLNDSILPSKIALFRQSLIVVIRTRFLEKAMNYCIAEMKAWLEGKHDSNVPHPILDDVISDEIITWPSKLGEKDQSWNEMIEKELSKKDGEIQIPMATLLSNPALMRNYIGISIGDADNCPGAILRIDDSSGLIKNPLANDNAYYQHCLHIYKDEYHQPKKPRGFGVDDFLLLLVLPFVFGGLSYLIFVIEKASFWRIFFLLPLTCWLGLGIEWVENNFNDVFPFVNRRIEYERKYNNFRNELLRKENCKEYNVL